MKVIRDIGEAREEARRLHPTVLVPTLGALHEGHLSLIRAARSLGRGAVVVSIFVNPTQFGLGEDYQRYPRPIDRDLELCRAEGVDLVFHPETNAMYPPGEAGVVIDVPSLTCVLEGEHRPGHFIGVCRVVAKLFNILRPAAACFGRKDYQQLRVIEAMTAGLGMPIEIIACPTVREADGLAMSSRNAYLTPAGRPRAAAIHQALRLAARLVAEGQRDPEAVERAMHEHLIGAALVPDYATLRDPVTLEPIGVIESPAQPLVALIAARLDGVRLIDNLMIPSSG